MANGHHTVRSLLAMKCNVVRIKYTTDDGETLLSGTIPKKHAQKQLEAYLNTYRHAEIVDYQEEY